MTRRDEVAARLWGQRAYPDQMKENDHIRRHLEICQRVYERLVAEGKWPFPDSTESEDLIESESEKNEV